MNMPQNKLPKTTLRPALTADLAGIEEIYSYYVVHSTATYQTETGTLADRVAWFKAHDSSHPIVVAEQDGVLVGWGSLSPFRSRAAYDKTVENSVYIREGYLGQGLGSLLLAELIRLAKILGHHTIIAGISADQSSSIGLHKKFGFSQVALLKEVGFKFGQWLDVTYMQLMISDSAGPP